MKRTKLLGASLLLGAISLMSCGGSQRVDMSKWEFSPESASNIKVGILQPEEHEALSLAREGFVAGLAEGGFQEGTNLTITYQNANGDPSQQSVLAKSLVIGNDLCLGIGTSSSVALYSAARGAGKSNPILFTAVTDAESAKLVDTNENPGQFVTGTSDMNPVEAQINLIKAVKPDATKIGILYTQSETNSEVQANQAKAAAEKAGLSVTIETCTDASDLTSVASHICRSGIDALYVPTDNVIAAHTDAVKRAVNESKVLCVAGEESIMKGCGHVTLSVNYFNLGKMTGRMAAKIMKGEKKPNEIPVEHMPLEECSKLYSSLNINTTGLDIDKNLLDGFVDVDDAR